MASANSDPKVGAVKGDMLFGSEYETMKDQFDQAMLELNSVRSQYMDSKKRCDNAQEKLDYYIEQYTTAMSQLDTALQDGSALREKFTDVSNEKLRLQQRVNHLEKKLERIIESMKLENGNSQTICAFLEQYNELKKKYEQNRAECITWAKETEMAKKKCNELIEDRNSLALEKDELKHQLLVAVRQYDLLQRDREKALKQNDDIIKDLNQLLDTKVIELRRSTEQRNAAEQELSLILSEKDSVLKENQKLSDDLLIVMKKSGEIESRYKEENQDLLLDIKRLKQDIANSLKSREDLAKECDLMREKMNNMSISSPSNDSKENILKGHPEFKSISNENWSKEFTGYNLSAAQQEIEILRKQLDKVHGEMAKSTQDIELAKSRRDWAITERQKIVQERDSVKILCDELRRERDTAISELLAAIRDSESIKKQKDEACKEIDQLKEQLDVYVNKTTSSTLSARNSIRWSYSSHDKDSVPFRKTDTEIIDIDIIGLPSDGELGLVLDGGRDEMNSSMFTENSGVYIVSIMRDSVCDGKLRPNDCIVKVNNLDCSNVSRRVVLETIRSSAPRCKVVVKRQLMNTTHLYTSKLNLKSGRAHGLSFECGILISKIDAGSLASRDNNLAVGDRLISINKRSMDGFKNPNDVLLQLDDPRIDTAVIVAVKQIGQTNSRKLVHSNKMINTCTQTDDMQARIEIGNDIQANLSAATLPVNNNINVDSNGNYVPTAQFKVHSSSMNSASPLITPPTTTKSTSKLTEILNIIRGKSQKYNGDAVDHEQSQSQCEKDAIFLLDSVLNGENIMSNPKGSSMKRTKKKKDVKDRDKTTGTWPRANIISHDGLSGTIVQKFTRKRPTLSVFNSVNANEINELNTNANQDVNKVSTKKPPQHDANIYLTPYPVMTSSKTTESFPTGNSRIQPNFARNRHSLLNPIISDSKLPPCSESIGHLMSTSGGLISSSFGRFSKPQITDSELEKKAFANRLSLNLTAFDKNFNSVIDQELGRKTKPIVGQTIPHYGLQAYPSKPNEEISNGTNSREKLHFAEMQKVLQKSKYNDFWNQESNTMPTYGRRQCMESANTVYDLPVNMEGRGYGYHPPTKSNIDESVIRSTIINRSSDSFVASNSQERTCFHYKSLGTYHENQQNCIGKIGYADYHNYSPKVSPHYTPFQGNCRQQNTYKASGEEITHHYHGYEGNTFPRKKENQRLPISPVQMITPRDIIGIQNSTGSIEQYHGSERGSPMPIFQVEVLSHGSNLNKRNARTEYCFNNKSSPGDLRRVTIDKSVEPLGITIRCNNNGGGIFVATVSENSIASQVGLQTGDQLLEVCGLNMRSATYDLAASVLRQCGNTMTMLVQYNPDKYDVDTGTDEESMTQSRSSSPKNQCPERNTVNDPSNMKPTHMTISKASTANPAQSMGETLFQLSASMAADKALVHQKHNYAKLKPSDVNFMNNIINEAALPSDVAPIGGPVPTEMMCSNNNNNNTNNVTLTHKSEINRYEEEPRMLIIETKKKALGVSFVGGNVTGIFVHRVVPESLGENAGIRIGDQILEFNGVDLRAATAEEAYLEIAKPVDKILIVVQNNIQKFTNIDPDQESIDSLYIKVAFDQSTECNEMSLRFAKDDVLYVDNTMFTGTPGLWRAWTLDEYGHRIQCGLIPSQSKIEDELRLHQETSESDTTSRRGIASARRSFFRRKKHPRSSSRDSKELASFSNTQLSWFSDSGLTIHDENSISTYIRMERLDYSNYRPLLILGPLAEFVVEKLHFDFPKEFERCKLQSIRSNDDDTEKIFSNNLYVDYRRRGSIYEFTSVEAIKEIRDKKRHCCLDVSVSAIERLQRLQIYPIVLLLRYRSAKQIKEVRESRYATDKFSAKAAKEMYEHGCKLESDYRHLISAIIPAGVNINHVSSQVKMAVEDEQKKVLWIPYTPANSTTSI